MCYVCTYVIHTLNYHENRMKKVKNCETVYTLVGQMILRKRNGYVEVCENEVCTREENLGALESALWYVLLKEIEKLDAEYRNKVYAIVSKMGFSEDKTREIAKNVANAFAEYYEDVKYSDVVRIDKEEVCVGNDCEGVSSDVYEKIIALSKSYSEEVHGKRENVFEEIVNDVIMYISNKRAYERLIALLDDPSVVNYISLRIKERYGEHES